MTDERPEAAALRRASAIDRVRLDPRLRTRDDSGVAAITIGTIAWAVAWLVVTFAPPSESQTWSAVCAAGFILGLIGLVFLLLRRRRIRNARDRGHRRQVHR